MTSYTSSACLHKEQPIDLSCVIIIFTPSMLSDKYITSTPGLLGQVNRGQHLQDEVRTHKYNDPAILVGRNLGHPRL